MSKAWLQWFVLAFLVGGWGCGGDDVSVTPGSSSSASSSGSSSASSSGGGEGGSSGGGVGGTAGSGGSGGSSGSSSGGGGGGAWGLIYPDPDWQAGKPEDHGLDPTLLGAAATVADQNESYCLLVIRHGYLIGEWYWRGSDKTTKQKSWSIAKSYSSAIVGIALQNGHLQSLDQKVADIVPEWKGTPKDQITIRHLLSGTSGLAWDVFSDYVTMATFAQDQTQHALNRDYSKAPEMEWKYNNAAVQIIEPVIRNATGKTLEQYADEHLWKRLGMSATWAQDKTGHPTAYANVLSSCRDHARFGYLYLHGGRWANDVQVVPSAHVTESLTPSNVFNRAYGFLWWLNGEQPAQTAMMEAFASTISPASPPDMFAAQGFGNQFIDVIPSLDMMVVRFGTDPLTNFNLAELTKDMKFEKHEKIISAVLQAVKDK